MDKFADNYLKFWKVTVILMIIGVVLGIIMSITAGAMMNSVGSQLNL